MRLGNNVKATVFEAKRAERRKNTVVANISTYEGKDQQGKNIYSSWKAMFVGDAYEAALDLHDKDRIIITTGKVDNHYDKEAERLYVTVTIFDFEEDDESTGEDA